MRTSLRTRIATAVVSVLALASCAGEPDLLADERQRELTNGSAVTSTTAPPLVNVPGGFLTGVVEPTREPTLPTVLAFSTAIDREPELVSVFTSFAEPFPTQLVAAIHARGAVPMVTLEPWPSAPGVTCSQPVTRCLATGAFDQVATQWATAAAAASEPFLLRFAHEPNLRHYPWGLDQGAPDDYVAAWHRMHRIFDAAGAANTQWVFAFQAPGGSNPDPDDWFPGTEFIDWIAIDGYNGGSELDWGGWLSFPELFARGLDATKRLAPRHPVMISETASANAGGNRAEWIRGMGSLLEEQPNVCSVVWFEIDKEASWSVGDHPPSALALAEVFDDLVARDDRDASACV